MSDDDHLDLPEDLRSLAEDLQAALVARAGDEPDRVAGWAAIDQARRSRSRFAAVRPMHLLAAAAVAIVVAASVAVLVARDDSDVNTVDSPSSPTTGPGTTESPSTTTAGPRPPAAPDPVPVIDPATLQVVAATLDGAIVSFEPSRPAQRTTLVAAQPGSEVVDLSIDPGTGDVWFTRNDSGTCTNVIYRMTAGQAPVRVADGFSPVVRDGRLAYFPSTAPAEGGFCDKSLDPITVSIASGLYPANWHNGRTTQLVIRDLETGSEHPVWTFPESSDEINGTGRAVWSPDGGHVGFERFGVNMYDASTTNGPPVQWQSDPTSAVGPVAFAPRSDGGPGSGVGFRLPAGQDSNRRGAIVALAGPADLSGPWTDTGAALATNVPGVLALDEIHATGQDDALAVTGSYDLLLWIDVAHHQAATRIDGRFVDAAFATRDRSAVEPTTTTAPTSSTTTSTEEPTTTTTTTSTPPGNGTSTAIELHGNGVGVANFGDAEGPTIAAVTTLLGSPSGDSGYVPGGGYYSYATRLVTWGNLTLLFGDETGSFRFVGWWYQSAKGNQVLPLPNGLTLGMPAEQVKARAPTAVTYEGLEGAMGICFLDSGRICAVPDDPPLGPEIPDPLVGTIVEYLAGVF